LSYGVTIIRVSRVRITPTAPVRITAIRIIATIVWVITVAPVTPIPRRPPAPKSVGVKFPSKNPPRKWAIFSIWCKIHQLSKPFNRVCPSI
jgi:hypothetical protein